jgi:hypothetical protein
MRRLNDADFIDLWEKGFRRHPVDRALLMLVAAFPEIPYEALADWPLGRRNRALIEVRLACFGSHLRGWVACTACQQKLEFEIDARTLAPAEADTHKKPDEPIEVNGHAFRLVTSRDLAFAARAPDPDTGAARLVESCRLDASGLAHWTEDHLAQIGERLALADPLAELRLALSCPECGALFEETLDIASFLWFEIDGCVRRLLREIHTLASAYGWTEQDVLALSPNRRALYMEMAQT